MCPLRKIKKMKKINFDFRFNEDKSIKLGPNSIHIHNGPEYATRATTSGFELNTR
jgi:hypothetical protein